MKRAWPRLLALLAHRHIMHVTLPAIMLYLVVGTLAQKSEGLYASTQHYFLAPFVTVAGLPLPGLPLFMALLVLNLSAHLWRKASMSRQRMGTVLTHAGVILLLLSALLTSLVAQEGYIDLREGDRRSHVSDYHQRVVVVRDLTRLESHMLPFAALATQESLPIADTFTIRVTQLCSNCGIQPRGERESNAHGMAKGMQLVPKPPELENEANMAGISFAVEGSQQDGHYAALENIPALPEFVADGRKFTVAVEKQRRRLPFTVELLRTDRQLYPGTTEAKEYRSRVRIHDGGQLWEAELSLNEPVRYKGYALFQSSYIEDPQGRRSVLAVVHNPIRMFPYIAGAMISLGMVWHMLRRRGSLVALFLVLAVNLAAPEAQAAEGYDLESFARLPILSEGRVRPLANVARERMAFISGTQSDAVQHFATILVQPDRAETMPLIRITNPGVRAALELPPAKHYSARQLAQVFAAHTSLLSSLQNKTQLTEEQRHLVEAYERYMSYHEIAHALDAYRPLKGFPLQDLPAPIRAKLKGAEPISFASSLHAHAFIDQQTRALVKRKGTQVQRYTPEEQALSYLSYMLAGLRAAGERSGPLNLVHDPDYMYFASPWAIVLEGAGGPAFAASLAQWQQLIARADNPAAWNETLRSMGNDFSPSFTYRVERYVGAVPWLKLAAFFYALALGALLAAYLAQRAYTTVPALSLAAGIIMQALDTFARILILGRPPVGTLYESILFAGLVLAASSYWRFRRTRESFWLWLSAAGGLLLALLAFANRPEPGNSTILTAVLNTNFWLTTHVLMITAGYAFSLLTALLAHRVLFVRAISDDAYAMLKRSALLALVFCATGTMLGGIWADQSWGRFWGWDPKENGALLLVLWLIWFLHGAVTHSMPRLLVVVGMALLSVVVALSWLGVNLLNVGLHSYGFTQGTQWGLALFATVEIGLIGVLAMRLRGRR